MNRIPSGMLVKAGSTLLVARTDVVDKDAPERLADHGQMQLQPEIIIKKENVQAKKGDTLAQLANRLKMPVANLMKWNNLSAKSSLKKGQTLVVFREYRAGAVPTQTAEPAKETVAPSKSTQHESKKDRSIDSKKSDKAEKVDKADKKGKSDKANKTEKRGKQDASSQRTDRHDKRSGSSDAKSKQQSERQKKQSTASSDAKTSKKQASSGRSKTEKEAANRTKKSTMPAASAGKQQAKPEKSKKH
jgi:membrane-bound lytic murein transglycosylase D